MVNAKCQRPGVCNAVETLLVHRAVAEKFLPKVAEELRNRGVTIRGCSEARAVVPWLEAADESDWETEYLDLILAVKVVGSLDEAVEHIERYGTGHSEAILTSNYNNARRFLEAVDAAAVYVNASPVSPTATVRLGRRNRISTQKLHARGPWDWKLTTTNM